jgi:hypothetical protein
MGKAVEITRGFLHRICAHWRLARMMARWFDGC